MWGRGNGWRGFGMGSGYGFGRRGRWSWCPWRRWRNKMSLREYRRWLEEELKMVDQALKEKGDER